MQAFTLFAVILGLGSALALPTGDHGLVSRNPNQVLAHAARDLDCGGTAYCADCYPDDCGLAATVNFIEGPLNVGTVPLSQISDLVANHCSENPETGVGSCTTDPIDLDTTLPNGDAGKVSVSIGGDNFPGWAKNLLVAATLSALQGSAVKNTGYSSSGTADSGPTTNTVPASFAVAVLDNPEQTIVIGMSVIDVEPESSDALCSGILGVGAAIAGLAPEVGGLLSIAFTIASVFCNI